jgi:hypothetical protein
LFPAGTCPRASPRRAPIFLFNSNHPLADPLPKKSTPFSKFGDRCTLISLRRKFFVSLRSTWLLRITKHLRCNTTNSESYEEICSYVTKKFLRITKQILRNTKQPNASHAAKNFLSNTKLFFARFFQCVLLLYLVGSTQLRTGCNKICTRGSVAGLSTRRLACKAP